MQNLVRWVAENKKWVFSGIGLLVISGAFFLIKQVVTPHRPSSGELPVAIIKSVEVGDVHTGGNVAINTGDGFVNFVRNEYGLSEDAVRDLVKTLGMSAASLDGIRTSPSNASSNSQTSRRSAVELPSDISQPAVVWIEPGLPPVFDSLTDADKHKLLGWAAKKQEVIEENEVMIIWKELRRERRSKDSVNVFQPPTYDGRAVRGGPRQELSDGRLHLAISTVEKKPYGGRYGHEYVVSYALKNQNQNTVEVDHFENLFFEPSGVLAVGFAVHNLKRNGNNYSDTDEPFVYAASSSVESSMSSRGDCRELNNICLHVFYADGTETMFVVYIPSELILDKT